MLRRRGEVMDREMLGIVIMVAGIAGSFALRVWDNIASKRQLARERREYRPEDSETFAIWAGTRTSLACALGAAAMLAPLLLGSTRVLALQIGFGVIGALLVWMLITNCVWRVTVYNDRLTWRDGYGRLREYPFSDVMEMKPSTRRQGYYRFRFNDGKELTIERSSQGLMRMIRRIADRTGCGLYDNWEK